MDVITLEAEDIIKTSNFGVGDNADQEIPITPRYTWTP